MSRYCSDDTIRSQMSIREEIAVRTFASLAAVMPRNLKQAAYLAVVGAEELIEALNESHRKNKQDQ